MAKRISVVISQGQSANPARRTLEEDLVTQLILENGIEVTVIPNLYDLKPDGTGMLCLDGINGSFVLLSWLYPRAAHWTLDRNGIRGQIGTTLLKSEDDDDEDEEQPGSENVDAENIDAEKQRVIDHRELPNRKIYCIDLKSDTSAQVFIDEILRIRQESTVQTVNLMDWISGDPTPSQQDRFLNSQPNSQPSKNHEGNGNGNGQANDLEVAGPIKITTDPIVSTNGNGNQKGQSSLSVEEKPQRRWYPIIDFSRCTNCMECIDFCLFGVYGIDQVDTILVEQPDNCRKGCPACSRVCPENAIIFPQHKDSGIAGSADGVASLKIDLSQLFGAPSAVELAAKERDDQLVEAGREAVGLTVGIPKRQADKQDHPRDDLDDLVDAMDDLDF